jgi:hypothetical protein
MFKPNIVKFLHFTVLFAKIGWTPKNGAATVRVNAA